jgi:hypothetical protein
MRYRFIDEVKGTYPLGLLCRVMRVSKSAYHAYRSGKTYVLSAAKAELSTQVEAVFYQHRRRYGSRRIMAELLAQGISVGRASGSFTDAPPCVESDCAASFSSINNGFTPQRQSFSESVA